MANIGQNVEYALHLNESEYPAALFRPCGAKFTTEAAQPFHNALAQPALVRESIYAIIAARIIE